MQSNQISKRLSSLKCFVGTFPRDLLPEKVNFRPAALVLNTDTSDKPGTHWVAIFLTTNGDGEYFDSFGFPPLTSDIERFMENNCINGWTTNNITFQTPALSSTCGHYCILYLTHRCRGMSFQQFIAKFSRNTFLNDVLATQYMRSKRHAP